MKQDWNLLRVLLARIEDETLPEFLADADSLNDWKEGQLLSEREGRQDDGFRVVMMHLEMLIDEELIKGVEVRESADGFFTYGLSKHPRLTMKGADLLKALREDGFWGEVKKFAKEKRLPLTVDALRVIIPAVMKQIIG